MQTISNSPSAAVQIEDDRTSISVEAIKRAFLDNLYFVQGKFSKIATKNDYYLALAYTVRDRVLNRWLASVETYAETSPKMVCYLSAEYLIGPQLGSHLINLGIYQQVNQAMQELGLDLKELMEQEQEPGLGNGGLGRLAACYLDSLASLDIPAVGYGIRYEFGIFDQKIHDGWQVEVTDKWLSTGDPWELPRPEWAVEVKFGGHTEPYMDEHDHYRVQWVPAKVVKGIPYLVPVPGYHTNTASTLRLWAAEAVETFNLEAFEKGDYYGAVQEKMSSENISKILYPNDEQEAGKELRLEQQFFFVSCSLQDLIRIHCELRGQTLESFHEYSAVQMNDTHPAIAVAELMRLLVDEHCMDWDRAWYVTTHTLAYTNHTLLPEALEKWPVPLFASILPRHLEIIYEINRRFLDEVRIRFPDDCDRLHRMSIIDETGPRYVRMAYLACVGSHAVNGVAELHSTLLQQTTLHDFYEMYPEKFTNVTNGVTPRRFLVLSNPRLADLISQRIGDTWIKNLVDLHQLEKLVNDPEFCHDFRQIKQARKQELAEFIHDTTGITVDPNSLFDIQVKRFHEYKRQHLNVLHIITLYHRLKANPTLDLVPRTFLFGGKAAPGYWMAKRMIKLINSVAEIINRDPDIQGRIKVVFLPDYNVKFAQRVYPAADLSEQISTAGYEASGTSNMKFAMNGALTIGTLDGANIEIRREVGPENFFLFGLTAAEVVAKKTAGYHPGDYYNGNSELKLAIDRIAHGVFSHGDTELFKPIVENLLSQDPFMVLADYHSYIECQERVSRTYRDWNHWTRMSILNVARIGKFSSDRAIREYCQRIWHVEPVQVDLEPYSQANAGRLV